MSDIVELLGIVGTTGIGTGGIIWEFVKTATGWRILAPRNESAHDFTQFAFALVFVLITLVGALWAISAGDIRPLWAGSTIGAGIGFVVCMAGRTLTRMRNN